MYGSEELPCIWVLAGVLSYRACDRNYDCEHCELYRALRGRTGPDAERMALGAPAGQAGSTTTAVVDDVVNAYVCYLTAGCTLHFDRPYSPDHFWLDRTNGHVAVGLDDHVLRVLYPVEDIVPPKVGMCLKRGEPCGWVVRRRSTIPLTMPVSGEVREVNGRFVNTVRDTHRGGDDEPWFFRVEPNEDIDAVPGLYRGEQALQWYLHKIQVLKRHLQDAVVPEAQRHLGAMMADGGTPSLDLEAILGREGFEALVDEIFRVHI